MTWFPMITFEHVTQYILVINKHYVNQQPVILSDSEVFNKEINKILLQFVIYSLWKLFSVKIQEIFTGKKKKVIF